MCLSESASHPFCAIFRLVPIFLSNKSERAEILLPSSPGGFAVFFC